MHSKTARIGPVVIGEGHPLALIAGPCVIESREHTLKLAQAIRAVCNEIGVPLVFKASFDKANRSSIHSFRGPGLSEGLRILAEVKDTLHLPVLSDIHEPAQATPAAQVLDCLQIPAFLCRQTDLLIAAAKTKRCVNVKKGQFLSPEEMKNVAEKLREAGSDNFLFTERGTFFGYHRLVNDMTAILRMKEHAPVVFDATHSCQYPGAGGTQTSGDRRLIRTLAFAAVAAGADALFLEVHDRPESARSDAATVLPLSELGELLQRALRLASVR